MAVTCASPATYETYQIKGHALSVTPTDEETGTLHERRHKRRELIVLEYGCASQILADQWMTLEGLCANYDPRAGGFLANSGPQRRSTQNGAGVMDVALESIQDCFEGVFLR